MQNGEFVQSVQEAAFRYNTNLLEGEDAMSASEMAEIMEEKMGKSMRLYMADRGMGGVDFRLVQQSRGRWQAESDAGTELIHQFDGAATSGDSRRMAEIQDEYAGMAEDGGGASKTDETVLRYMDGELKRYEVQVIQEPEEAKAVPKCDISCCGIASA